MNVADRAGRQPPTQEDESRSSEQKSPDQNIYRDEPIQFLDTTRSIFRSPFLEQAHIPKRSRKTRFIGDRAA